MPKGIGNSFYHYRMYRDLKEIGPDSLNYIELKSNIVITWISKNWS